jgi:polysaccharide pyruvyl transferase WcaK-like protein
MKVLLINDTTKWYHFGCTATSTALIDGIKKLGHTVTSLPITETYKIKSAPTTKAGFLNKLSYREFIANNPDLINLIKSHDAVVFNGEGTLHGINPAPVSLLYLAYITKKELGKHVEILNHSSYPQHDTSLGDTQESAIYKLVYNTIDFASIREPVSFNTMARLGAKVGEGFDCMPLYIRDHYIKSNIKHPNELLIAGSATWLQINIPSHERGNIEDFTQGLSGFNQYVQEMSSRGFKIKFLYGADSFPAKDDREFVEYMQKQFQANWEVYEATSLNDWLKTIEETTLLVSGRFHHTIAAASLGTHFIALNSNTPKIEGLMQILGSKEVVRYSDQAIYDKLLRLTNEKLPSRLDDVKSLQGDSHLQTLCIRAEKNFDGLKKNDLGIIALTGAELIEYAPLINYLSKEIIAPLIPFNTSFISDYASVLPDNNAFWVTTHFSLTSLGYFLLTASNPKISFNAKLIAPITSSIGYAVRLNIADQYKEAAETRLNNKIVADSEDEYSLFANCFNEIALSSTTAFIFSLPAAFSFAPAGVAFSAFSTFASATSSAMNCAASNSKITAPDNSFSGKVIPYLADTAIAISLINKVNFCTLYSLPEVAIALKQAFFILGSVVSTDQITKAIVEISPNSFFEYIDSCFGIEQPVIGLTPPDEL